MERLSPEDDYFCRCETARSPMHIGALQFYERADGRSSPFSGALVEHLDARLPATPLSRVRRLAPDEYDAAVWCDVARCDLSRHVTIVDEPQTRADVHAAVERLVMESLDPELPPFHIQVFNDVEGADGALFLRVHHSVADGLGFQSIMARLTDDSPNSSVPPAPELSDEEPPDPETWLEESRRRFELEAVELEAHKADRKRAKQALAEFENDPAHARVRPPRLERTVESSADRRFETLDLSLDRVRSIGRRFGGTINDAFLAIVSGAVRTYLSAAGELPDEPLVAVGARSYRRPEHGLYGNRIVNLMTSLATDVEDPATRFAEIRRASRVEIERSRLAEALLPEHDRPHGARARREQFEESMKGGRRILPGQVVVSNVPGPAEPQFLAGHRLRASYPAPILGYGRMLNVTLRRYVDQLQLGIMCDPVMLPDVETIPALLLEAACELEAIPTGD